VKAHPRHWLAFFAARPTWARAVALWGAGFLLILPPVWYWRKDRWGPGLTILVAAMLAVGAVGAFHAVREVLRPPESSPPGGPS
jgi:hypothetical protein